MTTAMQKIGLSDVGSVLAEIEQAFHDIPFENSDFQTEAFVINAQITPGRAYRAIGLRMMAKIQAVQAHLFAQERAQISLDEKQSLLQQDGLDSFERRRLEVDIREINTGRAWQDKLLSDALHELEVLYASFKRLPQYTRNSFEAEERRHFDLKLSRQLATQGNGATEALANMNYDGATIQRLALEAKQMIEGKE